MPSSVGSSSSCHGAADVAPFLLVGGLMLASLPVPLRRLGRRLSPGEWARLCLVALVGGAALIELGAVLWAGPTLLRAAGVPALAMACERLLGPLLPLGVTGGAFGLAVAAAVPILAWRGGCRVRAQMAALVIEPGVGRHQQRDGYDLVLLPARQPLAYSVGGPVPQVVISQGLRDTLTDAQFEAVIAHEVAHLSHRHQRLLAWAAVAAGSLRWWPLSWRAHRVLRGAFERWADAEATGGDHRRRIALGEAIVATAMADQPAPVAGFSLGEATAERIEALQEPPHAPLAVHISFYVPSAVFAAVATVATAVWMSDVQLVVAMAGRCTV